MRPARGHENPALLRKPHSRHFYQSADELPRPGLERDSDSACILANEAEA
jgi:hypothetical protein